MTTQEPFDPYSRLAAQCRQRNALIAGVDGWLTRFTEATEEAYKSETEIPGWNDKQAQRVIAAHASEVLLEKVSGWIVENVARRLTDGDDAEHIVDEVEKHGGILSPELIEIAQERVDARRGVQEAQAKLDALTARS